MSDINAQLERFTKAGKVHPRAVLELVVSEVDGARSVEALLDPSISDDDALTGVRAIALYLLFDGLISDVSQPKLAELFGKPLPVVRNLINQISTLMERDPATRGKIQRLRARLLASAAREARTGTKVQEGETRMSRQTGGEDKSSGRKSPIQASSKERQAAILAIFEQHGSIRPRDLARELKDGGMDMSKPTIARDLAELMRVQQGRIIASGTRGSRRYSLDGRTASGAVDSVPSRKAPRTRSARPDSTAGAKRKSGRAKPVKTAPASTPAPAAVPTSADAFTSALALISPPSALVRAGHPADDGQPLVQLTARGAAVIRQAGAQMVDNFRTHFDAALTGQGSPQAAEQAAFLATVFLRGAAGTIPLAPFVAAAEAAAPTTGKRKRK